jgi:phospholipase C
VWDDWGGLYDHVPPPNGLGFRTPAMTISPYAKRGYIDHTQGDFGSILRFIEYNWNLKHPLTLDHSTTSNMTQNFDFAQTPRSPEVLPLRQDCQQFRDQRVYHPGQNLSVSG